MDIDKLINSVRNKAKETSFSGVVTVYQGENALYQEAFGYADIAERKKNNVETKFAIASGTKFFTALGIGSLIDAGKLSPDTTVNEIFRQDLSFIEPGSTIAQLLSHTSGIYDYYDEELDIDTEDYFVDIPWSQLETPSDYLPLFQNKQPKFTAGERFSYSNGGFIFCGIIIEHITGQLYRDYIQENVFLPAGMNGSGYYAFNRLPENTANGYKTNADGAPETNIYNLPIRGGSDGGAFTTVTDIHKLWTAFLSNRILSERLTGMFLTSQVNIRNQVNYGYGLYLVKYQGMDMVFFTGGDAGVGFDSRCIPEKEFQFTVISNFTDGEELIRAAIFSHLKEKPLD